MTSDLEIGFRKKPADLGDFLASQGYIFNFEDASSNPFVVYEHRKEGWPQLFYTPRIILSEDDVPNWQAAGYNIVSHLNINFPELPNLRTEAIRLARELGLKYNCVCFDPNEDDDEFKFSEGAEIGT